MLGGGNLTKGRSRDERLLAEVGTPTLCNRYPFPMSDAAALVETGNRRVHRKDESDTLHVLYVNLITAGVIRGRSFNRYGRSLGRRNAYLATGGAMAATPKAM